jgi:hypothetical protein
MKRLLLTIAVLAFMAGPALGGGSTVFDFGEAGKELLLRTQVTTITAEEQCMNLTQDTTANIANAACDSDLVNEMIWPQNAQVSEIKIVNLTVGDSTYACEFTLEVGGSAKVAVTTTANQLVSTVQTLPFKYNLADGDLVGIMVGMGTVCGDGTDPVYLVELWGKFVADDAF